MRRRLSRSLSPPRWKEYRALLEAALEHGYQVVSLENWVREGDHGDRTLVLRHDVDQHPRSALRMAAIEQQLGLRSTWYFRWRTARTAVVSKLRDAGFAIGLHYETATRTILDRGGPPEHDLAARFEESRPILRAEIRAFADRHGPIRSVCPHGDSRVPGVNNGMLLRDADLSSYGVEFDGNEAMRGRRLGHWLTDRSAPEGGWRNGVDPHELLERGVSPILCLTHPNNWSSGLSLWIDRILTAALPKRWPERPIRTGGDDPPLEEPSGTSIVGSAVGADIDARRFQA